MGTVMVRFVHNIRRRVWRLRNVSLLLVACSAIACGNSSPTKKVFDAISQQEAEEVRDGCVADSLALLQALGDRIAPLARARDLEGLELTAAALGCSFETTTDGYRLLCPAMDLRGTTLAVELYLRFTGEDTVLQVSGSDAAHSVDGILVLRSEPERGLVLQGAVEATDANGCRAVAEFDEVIGLEAIDLPGDRSALHFREGAVELIVFRENALELARGSAALTGRNAFVVLNFDDFSLLSELTFE